MQTDCVAANLGGVAAHLSTVELAARASVVAPLQPLVVGVVLAALSLETFLIKCLSIEMIQDVPAMVSILMMLSLLLLDLLMDLAQPETLQPERESSQLSLVKPLMKQQVDGQLHRMVRMHGDTALLGNKTTLVLIVLLALGHALPADSILDEDPFN